MTSFGFMWWLHLAWICHLSSGELLQESNTVYTYGLPELTKDILERIKLATGQPINTNRFFPIRKLEGEQEAGKMAFFVAASSKGYDVVEYQPYTKTTKFHKASKNNKLDGGHYQLNKGDDKSGRDKDHFFEIFEQEKDGNELASHEYDDESGHEDKYSEESYYSKNHHKSNAGKKGGKFKKGRKRGKFHVEKGFRDIYYKDEEKKSDFYWNNQHEEGKWMEYGFKNKKTQKSNDKGDEGKKEKSKSEESSYENKENKCTKCKT